MTKTSIVLVDDHAFLRQQVRDLLEYEPDFVVIGEAADGLQAIESVKCLQPDVLIADVMMPGLNGLEAARQVRQSSPKTRVIILSMYANEAYIHEALKNGAVGYVLKDRCADDLVRAIREACAERPFLSVPFAGSVRPQTHPGISSGA